MRFMRELSPERESELRGKDGRVTLVLVFVELTIGVATAFADALTERVTAVEAVAWTVTVELGKMSTKTVVVAMT